MFQIRIFSWQNASKGVQFYEICKHTTCNFTNNWVKNWQEIRLNFVVVFSRFSFINIYEFLEFRQYFIEESYLNGNLEIFYWIEKHWLFLISFPSHLYQWNIFFNPSPKEYTPQTRLLQWLFLRIGKNGDRFIFNWSIYYKLRTFITSWGSSLHNKLRQSILQIGAQVLRTGGVIVNRGGSIIVLE